MTSAPIRRDTAAWAVLGTPPGNRPVVGHALRMRRDAFGVMDSARGLDIAVLRLGPKPAYVISHPDLVRQLLTAEDRNLDKGPLYENLARLIGVSIGTLTGADHRARRRMVAPVYRPDPALMADCAVEVVGSWRSGEAYDLAREMRRYSFMVKARTLFAGAVPREAEAEFVDLLPIALVGVAKYMADPTGLVQRLPTADNRRINAALARLKEIIERAIAVCRRSGTGGQGILAALVEASDPRSGAPLSDDEIRNEAMVLLSAGSETVAGVLAHAANLLARDPATTEALRAEADQVVGGPPVREDALAGLAFTRRVVTELLRLYPAGALMSRRAAAVLDLGGHRIPDGAAMFFCPYLLHRRPELYPNPDRFDPDRWLPERAGTLPRGAFMPFGAGPHICVGEQIAWSEMLIAVATMAASIEFTPVPGTPEPRPVLAPTLGLDSVPVTVEERK
ncbi:cytochrome P450 [Pseudonocardia eucalypti]|uniref:Cytochrome P450 n=1 Tax=Pseudonocardia eucalypti TaxID=648755 RepID=A0ABP9Q1R5_9PSEU|nr:pentalenene oxygenase [Pseudonocardia eucalypti]